MVADPALDIPQLFHEALSSSNILEVDAWWLGIDNPEFATRRHRHNSRLLEHNDKSEQRGPRRLPERRCKSKGAADFR